MVNPQKTMRSIRGIVSAGDFFTETGKAAYSAARALIDNGKDCDIILIQEEAENQGMHLSGRLLQGMYGADAGSIKCHVN